MYLIGVVKAQGGCSTVQSSDRVPANHQLSARAPWGSHVGWRGGGGGVAAVVGEVIRILGGACGVDPTRNCRAETELKR